MRDLEKVISEAKKDLDWAKAQIRSGRPANHVEIRLAESRLATLENKLRSLGG